jgi:hypothetical protein
VNDGVPYQVDMGGGFCPFRRDVDWRTAVEAPIKPLIGSLQFTAARSNWGFQLRFGLFEISEHDMAMIATAMGVMDVSSRAESPACLRRQHCSGD